ncbi:MAG: DUF5723 family protein [Cytophagaceae bacterium]
MFIKRLLIAAFTLSSVYTFAQNNIGTRYGNHNDLNASKYQPSELDLGDRHGQIGFNYYLWMGNTAFDYKTSNDIYQTGEINNKDIDKMISRLSKNNLFGVGQDYQVLGVAFQLRTESDKRFDVSLSLVDKFALSFLYTDNFMKFALKGNKQFAGQTVNLGPTTVNLSHSREYVVGTAFPILGNEKTLGIRAGLRAKYIQGIAALYMPKGNANMHTEKDGRYIDFSYDYDVYTSGLKNFSAFNFNGSGYGFDAGMTFYLGKNLQVVTSLLDVGSIYYNNNTTNYQNQGGSRYEGLVISNLFGNTRFESDSAQQVFQPNINQNKSFRMPLGTKLCIEGEIKTPRIGKDDREFVSNAIFFTYIQGFNNMPGATTRPFFSVGYNHDFHRVFDGGIMGSIGGFNRYGLGAFLTLKLGKSVKFGLSSDNLVAFVMPEYGTGIDVATNFSISF